MNDTTRLALTTRQQQIYDFIVSFTRERTYQPSMREIMLEFGFRSTNSVKCHLRAIERKGYIEQTGHSRGLIITELLPVENHESYERK